MRDEDWIYQFGKYQYTSAVESHGLDETTQLAREGREEKRLGREKDSAEKPEKRPLRKGKPKRVDAQKKPCCSEIGKMKTEK